MISGFLLQVGAVIAWASLPAPAQWSHVASLPAARRAAHEGDLECALKMYTDFLARHPDDREALKGRGQVLLWNTRYADAEVDYRRANRIDPLDAETSTGLSLVLIRENRFEEAEARLRKLLSWRKDEHDAVLLLGEVLLRTDRAIEAEAEFERATTIEPEDPRGEMGRARALAASGREHEARSVDEATAAALGKRIAKHPEDTEARVALASVLLRIDRAEDSVQACNEALRRAPGNREAELGRASAELRLGRLEAAEAHVRGLLHGHSDSADAHALRGELCLRLRRFPEAERAYACAIELDPWNPQHRLGIAQSRSARGDVEGARAALADAMELDPWSRDVRDLMARLESVRTPWRFRLDMGARLDQWTGPQDDWWQETAHLAWRARDDLALGLGIDGYQRFDLDDVQVTADATWRISEPWTLSTAYTYGSDALTVARDVFDTEVSRRVGSASTALLRWRYASYAGDVHTNTVSPGFEFPCSDAASLLARYYFVNSNETGDGHAGSLRLELFPEGPVRTRLGVAYGTESFLASTVTQAIRTTDVLTLFGSVEWRLSKRTIVSLAYDFEDHEASADKQGVALGFTVEF